ncbi:MAG: methyltransferase domain-containing protein [bacterium]|nr:methyltransferase domain-containing protein [bacterium]
MGWDSKGRIYENYTKHVSQHQDVSGEGLKRWSSYYQSNYAKFLPPDKEARILDVGCGYGRVMYFLRSAGYNNVTGIDISPQQIEAARKNGFTRVEKVSAFEYLADKEEQFDIIFMIDILEHIEKAEVIKLLDRILLALKPSGRLVLQLPNALTPLNVYLYRDFTHETAFTVTSIEQILGIARFQNIRTYPIPPHIHGPKSLAFNLLWRIIWQNLIRFYMLTANGDLMGDIYTSNLIAVAEKG